MEDVGLALTEIEPPPCRNFLPGDGSGGHPRRPSRHGLALHPPIEEIFADIPPGWPAATRPRRCSSTDNAEGRHQRSELNSVGAVAAAGLLSVIDRQERPGPNRLVPAGAGSRSELGGRPVQVGGKRARRGVRAEPSGALLPFGSRVVQGTVSALEHY